MHKTRLPEVQNLGNYGHNLTVLLTEILNITLFQGNLLTRIFKVLSIYKADSGINMAEKGELLGYILERKITH